MIELIAFLGNPGGEYAQTRHNAGRLAAEELPFFHSLHWQRKYKGLYASIAGNTLGSGLPAQVHLLMPETYMNLSGDSIYPAAAFFKIPPERILLVHDELELPLGTVSLRFSGGLGGHKGLRSMKACFNTPDFWRLRIGIGRPNHEDIAGWVLSAFTEEEKPRLEPVLQACAHTLLRALVQGPETLLPEWNKKTIP